MGLFKVEFLSSELEMATCTARIEGPSEPQEKLFLRVQQGMQQRQGVGFA